MAESVSFKAYLKRDGQEVEVRRFAIDSGAATNYLYLQGKIQAVFPSIQNDQFNLFWQDGDNDYISVGSDEELLEALSANTVLPFKLYIKTKEHQSQASGDRQTHVGITCDGCNNAVVGRRYKCVSCPDFDLCSTCEGTGQHSEHFMLRITSPLGPHTTPKFFRKCFGRPHKFFKHGMDQMGHHMRGERNRSCPFNTEERSRESRGGATGVTDMFDFSALMEFINSLGMSMAAGQREASEPQAQQASGSQSASAQASASAPTQASAGQRQPPHVDYLSNLGQAITDLLDPFDGSAEEKEILNHRLTKTKKIALTVHKKCKKMQKKIHKRNMKLNSMAENFDPELKDDGDSVTLISQPNNKKLCGKHTRFVSKPNKHGRELIHILRLRTEHGNEGHYGFGTTGRGRHGHGPLGTHGHGPRGHGHHGHGPHGHGHHGHGPHGHGPHRPHRHGPRGHGHGPHGHGPHGHSDGAGSDGEQQLPQSYTNSLYSLAKMYYTPQLITLDDDLPVADDCAGVDVSFEVRPKNSDTQEAGTSAPAPTPAATEPTIPCPSAPFQHMSPGANPTPVVTEAPMPRSTGLPFFVAPAQSPAATGASVPRSTGLPLFVAPAQSPAATEPPTPRSTGSPVAAQREATPPPPTAAARRNSDDWTLLNRESPTRNVETVAAAMEVEEMRGATASAMYPVLPQALAPLPVNKEDEKIQEAVDRIMSMGFTFDQTVLRELLKQANCDIASVLEKLLSNRK